MDQSPDTVVLITPICSEPWIDRYTARGYWVIAPAWPGLEPPTDEIAGHYESIISELDRPPIIIGNASGGTVTEMLLSRGFGAAGVSIGGSFAVGREGWEEVADFALDWAIRIAGAGAPALQWTLVAGTGRPDPRET
jgi:hypothetical protein